MTHDGKRRREYRAAGGVVVDPKEERVLTLLRPDRSGPDGQAEVRLPKGFIEPGETREATALREIEEEAGLSSLELLADLGNQIVEFKWMDREYRRDESYFLLRLTREVGMSPPERQFRRLWLSWEEAIQQLSFRAEREWVLRAREEWKRHRTH